MSSNWKNVAVLAIAQALMMSAGTMVVFIGGIIGADLAPKPGWATLPVASIVVGTAVSSIPVALSMRKYGRKKIFIFIASVAVLAGLLSAYSILIESFYLLCFSFVILGIGVSSVNQFRFAAMESVAHDKMPIAASAVLFGGIFAGYIGPQIAAEGQFILSSEYAGSFILLAVVFLLGAVMLSQFKNVESNEEAIDAEGRDLVQIVKQPIFLVAALSSVVGYGVMSFIMTATPISMHEVDGHAFHHTKWVIQSHIIAMFLPSLITPWLIKKWGNNKIIIAGVVIYAMCILIAFTGKELSNYWISLILLGLGWNFLFLGGTTLLPNVYRKGEQFKVQATNDFLVFGMQAIASLSAGFVVFTFGWKIVIASMVPMLLIPLIAILYLKASKK